MKYPKIQKLPSGSYRMQLQVNGERYSITDRTPALVKQQARELLGQTQDKRTRMTVEQAHEAYIAKKTAVLSPSTIFGYQISKRNYFRPIMNKPLDTLTQDDIDEAIAYEISRGISRKTIENAGRLLTAVLHTYRPKFRPEIILPAKQYSEISIPTESELQQIWQEMEKDKYKVETRLTILLASWIGLRMSEILGLRFSDIEGGHVNIHTAKVHGPNGTVTKGPKSYAGNRRIKIPIEIQNIIASIPHENESDFVIQCSRTTINRQFNSLCKNISIPQYRIHDLRHFSASEALYLNVPNKYQMRRMGHSTENMLQTVYQHVMRDKEDFFADIIDERMSMLYAKSAHDTSHA